MRLQSRRLINAMQEQATTREMVTITPQILFMMIASGLIMSLAYWWLGTEIMGSPLKYFDYLELTTLIGITITGSYQLFFWTQRNNYYFKTRCFKIALDDWIPFWPSWVWLYSLLYYALIGLIVISINSINQVVHLVFGGIVLLLVQCAFFMLIPCTVPKEWRDYKADTFSKKFLRLVQTYDNGRNCMPSMHMSVATFISLILLPVVGPTAYLFILLIALSCLFTKQHQILDIIPGILLGWLVFQFVF